MKGSVVWVKGAKGKKLTKKNMYLTKRKVEEDGSSPFLLCKY